MHPEHVTPLLGRVLDYSAADRVAAIFGVLADPTRARIVHALSIHRRPPSRWRGRLGRGLEILAAVANAVLLFGVAAYIGYEVYQRFSDPPEVQSVPMLAIASVGLVINLV